MTSPIRGSTENWDAREDVTHAALNRLSARLGVNMFDLVFGRSTKPYDSTPVSGWAGTEDALPLLDSGRVIQIAAGFGLFYDATVDLTDASANAYKPVVIGDAFNVTLDTYDSNPRFDLIEIIPARSDIDEGTRRFRPGGPLSTPVTASTYQGSGYSYEVNVIKGTPASSPTPPSPSGTGLIVAMCLVPATSGNVRIFDVRPFIEAGFGYEPIPARGFQSIGRDYARPVIQVGGQVTPDGGMVLDVGEIVADYRGKRCHVYGTSVTVATASSSHPRIDSVILRPANDAARAYGLQAVQPAVEIVTGTPATTPAPPSISGDYIKLADVLVGTSVTTINSGDITDLRPFGPYTDAMQSVVTVDPKVVVEAGSGTRIIGIQAQDADGNNVATRAVRFLVDLALEDGGAPDMTDVYMDVATGSLFYGSDGSGTTTVRTCFTPDTTGLAAFALVNTTGSPEERIVTITPVEAIRAYGDSDDVTTIQAPYRTVRAGRPVTVKIAIVP